MRRVYGDEGLPHECGTPNSSQSALQILACRAYSNFQVRRNNFFAQLKLVQMLIRVR